MNAPSVRDRADAGDVLLRLPRRYEDLRDPVRLWSRLPLGTPVYLVGTLAGRVEIARHEHPPRLRARLSDADGRLALLISFGPDRALAEALGALAGREIHLYGKVRGWHRHVIIQQPRLVAPDERGRVRAVYSGATGTQRQLSRAVDEAFLSGAVERVAARIRALCGLNGMKEMDTLRALGAPDSCGDVAALLRVVHAPPSPAAGLEACRVLRLLAALAVCRAAAVRTHARQPAPPLRAARSHAAAAASALPFRLHDDQQAALRAILDDVARPEATRRVLVGDVGAGKSAVFLTAAAAVVRAGGRAAVMSWSLPLARQLHGLARRWWPELSVRLVTGDSTARAPEGPALLVGTSALLCRDPGPLHLAVTDEQHKFSAAQRDQLGALPTHRVEVSATPIPRTLATLLYAGCAVSLIRRRHNVAVVSVRVFGPADRKRLLRRALASVESGAKVLVVYPAVREDNAAALPNVARAAERWRRHLGDRCYVAHGQMPREAALAAIEAFAAREGGGLLVTSALVEVGLDLPGIRHAIVVHAERFGLSQLHQLRGRLAREGGHATLDLFMGDEASAVARLRLEALVEIDDGFELARRDMTMRGIGEIAEAWGLQHGLPASFLPGHRVTVDEVETVAQKVPRLLEARRPGER